MAREKQPSARRATRSFAYKVIWSIEPRSAVGSVFLTGQYDGRTYDYHRYNPKTLAFERYMRVRDLGPITARTERGKIRQLLALRGTAHLRKGARAA
jgi:hypothetical protein